MPQIGEIRRPHEIGLKGYIKRIWHACEGCGRARWVQRYGGIPNKLRCQSCVAMGKLNHQWIGGRRQDAEGYIHIKLSPKHKLVAMTGGHRYIREHRLVMAEHLGRLLKKEEKVHHLNGNKSDNRLENLRLVYAEKHPLAYGIAYGDGYKQGYADAKAGLVEVNFS